MKPLQANSQCSNIQRHLKRGKGITRIEAFHLCRCANLWARIAELESRGYDIRHEARVKVAKHKYVTRYWLVRK